MQALEVNDLKLAYNKGQLVLDGVSFSVEPAEIIAAVGMSGSGKTTLLRAIAGFEKASSGEVFIHGVKVSGNGLHQKPEKRKVGFVFQDLALFGHMTVEQNVAFGISNKEEKNTLRSQLLQLVGLEGFEKRYPSQLSGGQQQRVAIARALATRPELLLMDEPFSSLDKGLRAQVRDEITDILKKSGTAAIIVTHDIEDAYAMANRILVLDVGKVVQFDTPEKTYRCPASEQVAKLGGKTNLVDASLISGELTGKVLIRPEHIQLAEQGDWKVATAVFHGQFHEYELRNGTQTLLVHSKELLETGTTTGISVDQKYIHPLS